MSTKMLTRPARMNTCVLHFLWSGTVGGAPRAVLQLINAQLRYSHFVPGIVFGQDRGPYVEAVRKLGCPVHVLNLKSDLKLYEALRIKDFITQYEIHHFHTGETSMMLSSILCPNAVRVYTHRGGRKTDYSGKKWVRSVIVGMILRRYFHGFSGNSKHACSSAAELFRIDQGRWLLTYNGLDFANLEPTRPKEVVGKELSIPNDTCVIGTCAELREWKRIDLLLRACAKLPRESYRLLIIGDGPARKGLEALAHDLMIGRNAVFAGMKNNVGDYLQMMDIFVLPSYGIESFGNAVVEAMSRRIPPIVFSDGGGLLEHVKQGENGYIVSSVEELCSQMDSLINNKNLRISLGESAQKFVMATYTPEKMASSYDRLYESALSRING